jgi:hypothetical protein
MKSWIVLVLVTAGALQAHAQKLSTAKMPQAAKAAFTKAHPGAQGKWEKEGGNYEVNFKEGGKETSCVIDKNGKIWETETEIPISALPVAVVTYVQKNYGKAKIGEAAKIVKADGSVVYEAMVNEKDLFFDSNGKPVKSDKEKED